MKTLNRSLLSACGVAALLIGTLPGCPDRESGNPPNYDALPDITKDGGDIKTDGPGPDTQPDGTPDGTPDSVEIDVPDDIEAPEGTVKALQLLAEDVGCDENMIQTVAQTYTLNSVVVTSPKYDAFTPTEPGGTALDGYFVADADGGLYSGVNVTIPRDDATDYKPGDVLELTGSIEEFYCNTQLDVTSHSLLSSGAAPQPTAIDQPAAIKNEVYEGMLVKVSGVEVTSTGQGGTYKISGDVTVGFGFDFFLSLDVGSTYDLTGVVRYSFGEYQLVPRSQGDIVKKVSGTNTTIVEIQESTESVDCTAASIQNIADGLTLTGTVVVGNHYVSGNLDGYYISDGSSDPYSGVLAVVPASAETDFAVGTELLLSGEHTEFYCLTEFGADSWEEVSTGNAVPAPVPVSFTDFESDPEAWEGVVIEVADIEVTDNSEFDQFGYASINGTDLLIDTGIVGKNGFDKPAVGTTYSVVRGAVRYAFDQYRISPRTPADLVVGGPADPQPEVVEEVPDAGPEVTDDADAGTPDAIEEVIDDAGPETVDDTTDDADAATDDADAATDAAADDADGTTSDAETDA